MTFISNLHVLFNFFVTVRQFQLNIFKRLNHSTVSPRLAETDLELERPYYTISSVHVLEVFVVHSLIIRKSDATQTHNS